MANFQHENNQNDTLRNQSIGVGAWGVKMHGKKKIHNLPREPAKSPTSHIEHIVNTNNTNILHTIVKLISFDSHTVMGIGRKIDIFVFRGVILMTLELKFCHF